MKKIKAKHSNNDRIIICSGSHGEIEFFYRPVGTKEKYWMTTDRFCPSVFKYFHKKGCNMNGQEFSLTIRQLYQFNAYHNHRLAQLMDRIPSLVDYVIQEYILGNQAVEKLPVPARVNHCEHYDTYEYELAA